MTQVPAKVLNFIAQDEIAVSEIGSGSKGGSDFYNGPRREGLGMIL
jgi:hypothetical protein